MDSILGEIAVQVVSLSAMGGVLWYFVKRWMQTLDKRHDQLIKADKELEQRIANLQKEQGQGLDAFRERRVEEEQKIRSDLSDFRGFVHERDRERLETIQALSVEIHKTDQSIRSDMAESQEIIRIEKRLEGRLDRFGQQLQSIEQNSRRRHKSLDDKVDRVLHFLLNDTSGRPDAKDANI